MSMNDVKAKALAAFAKIGTTNGTAPPHVDDNKAAIAHEYFMADALEAVAKKRKEQAKKQAEEAGLLGDRATFKPASTYSTYDGDHLSISARVASPAERIDKTVLANELNKALGFSKAQQVLKACTKESAAAVTYIVAAK